MYRDYIGSNDLNIGRFEMALRKNNPKTYPKIILITADYLEGC
jgi:hypothetical protein